MSFSREVVTVAVITGVLKVLVWVFGGVSALLLAVSCIPVRTAARIADVDVQIDVQDVTADGSGALLSTRAPADGDRPSQPSWTAEVTWLLGFVRFRSRGGPGQPGTTELRVLGVRRELQSGREKQTKRWREDGHTPQQGVPLESGHEQQRKNRRRRPEGPHSGRSGGQHREASDRPGQLLRSRRTRRSRSSPADLIRIARAVVQETPGLVPRLWRSLTLRIRGDLTYGFEDPFITGMSQAVLANVSVPADLRLTPDYSRGCLLGWGEATATVYPIKIIGIVLGTALRPAVRRLWWPRLWSALRLSKKPA